MFSFYYRSRLNVHLSNRRRYDNENLRGNARGLFFKDGYPGTYSYISIARSPDRSLTSFGSCPAPARRHRRAHRHRRHAPRISSSRPTGGFG
jgi:hypothetical protein